MGTRFVAILIPLSLLPGTPLMADDMSTSPYMGIELAIDKAREYIEQQQIDCSGKFITSVQYNRDMPNEYKRPYWAVRWAEKTPTKGGEVEVRLYADGAIEKTFYK